MAIKSTVFKAELNITDMDRGYYQSHALTIARHPSETDERMMLRLVAFARHASESLELTRGLSADDEPDVWQKDLTGAIETWIELGLPDEKRIKKGCGRANEVWIYAYGGRVVDIWWDGIKNALTRFEHLNVLSIPSDTLAELTQMTARTMQLQCTIQDGQLWMSDANHNVLVEVTTLQSAAV
ncbi:YaeQ family protein [Deefgea salmonis]|uniref:YaeQ family protein n=1 Tax=Deefgea salmonis TaxID=2875502 RepID=A0ABS8BMM9_9NEIS|nr:YaeQ family protein [Deefgea salmonis]MCB5196992.1 YaeQ family protein [Deefgea salmonis]